MSLVQRDFILRMIEAAGAAIARALRRRQSGDSHGARDEIAAAVSEVLGSAAPLVRMVNTRTAVDLISDSARVSLWARLLLEDARTLRAMSRASEATAAEHRALCLLLELQIRGAELPDEDTSLLTELARQLSLGDLPEPYRSIAATIAT